MDRYQNSEVISLEACIKIYRQDNFLWLIILSVWVAHLQIKASKKIMTIYHDYRKHWPIEKAKINDKIIVQTINTYKIAAIKKAWNII